MGKIIFLSDVTLTDLAAPKIVRRDPIESDGSLFLFDGAHQFGQFSGVPALNASIPNVLANEAAALLSVPETTLGLSVAATSGTVAGEFIIERTGKGGIHGISSLTTQTTSRQYVIRAPNAIRARIQNNPARAFYASIWWTVTRQGISVSNPAPQSIFHQAINTSNYAFHFQNGYAAAGGNLGATNVPDTYDYGTGPTVPYPKFGAVGWSQHTGTGPGAADLEFGLGNFGAWAGFNINKTASRIIYRVYLEDLTASGRTFAEVQAIDYSLFQIAFASGGKFYNDTFTSPTTLP